MEESKSYLIEKLNETNYRSWSQVLESHLDDQDLWGLVNGTEKQPTSPTNPTTSTQTTGPTERTAAATARIIWRNRIRRQRKLGS